MSEHLLSNLDLRHLIGRRSKRVPETRTIAAPAPEEKSIPGTEMVARGHLTRDTLTRGILFSVSSHCIHLFQWLDKWWYPGSPVGKRCTKDGMQEKFVGKNCALCFQLLPKLYCSLHSTIGRSSDCFCIGQFRENSITTNFEQLPGFDFGGCLGDYWPVWQLLWTVLEHIIWWSMSGRWLWLLRYLLSKWSSCGSQSVRRVFLIMWIWSISSLVLEF